MGCSGDSWQALGVGHTVLAVPVPALDDVVRERTAFYDASFVAADPDFVHAHITLLAPWAQRPSAEDLDRVARIAAAAEPFQVRLARVGEFPNGVIYLRPEPETQLRDLTSRLVDAFPQFPPYGGQYGDVVPHLTLDRRSATVTPATVGASVHNRLPLTFTAERIDLQWWANHDCRRLRAWPLGRAASLVG
jgi:2'-5' RNA ligase